MSKTHKTDADTHTPTLGETLSPDVLRDLTESFIPFNKFLGIKVGKLEPGCARLALPFRDEFVGDPLRPALHGGLIPTLADTAGGIAVWTQLRDVHSRVSTIDLRIDYLRPGRLETLLAEATVVRAGNRVGVVDIRLFHASDESETIATGKGVFNIAKVKASR
jgi:uncharacterized protein (TIGR00369 family)